jgi:septum site-determining protein MinC
MTTKQTVMLKGQRDGIHIFLDAGANMDVIHADLRKKVSAGRAFFEGADIKIAFKGRDLTELQEQELLDIIMDETSIEFTFVESVNYVAPPPADAQPTEAPPTVTYTESPTAYFRGGLRNGQCVKHAGSVVIMGDANAGSEIIAAGNVIVLGQLKGMAHAGCRGDASCFVSALTLRPTQLRIANIISNVPPPTDGGKPTPACAYLQDGEVFIVQM